MAYKLEVSSRQYVITHDAEGRRLTINRDDHSYSATTTASTAHAAPVRHPIGVKCDVIDPHKAELEGKRAAEVPEVYCMFGLVGLVQLFTGWYLIVVSDGYPIEFVGGVERIYRITDIVLLPVSRNSVPHIQAHPVRKYSTGHTDNVAHPKQPIPTQIPNVTSAPLETVAGPALEGKGKTDGRKMDYKGDKELKLRVEMTDEYIRRTRELFSSGSFYYATTFDLSRPVTHTHTHLPREHNQVLRSPGTEPKPQEKGPEGRGYAPVNEKGTAGHTASDLWQKADHTFVFNRHLLHPFAKEGVTEWCQPIIQGYFIRRKFPLGQENDTPKEESPCESDTDAEERDEILFARSPVPPDDEAPPLTEAEAQTNVTEEEQAQIHLTLFARRSSYRNGLRFKKRGIDLEGHVANYVETEQIVEVVTRAVKDPGAESGTVAKERKPSVTSSEGSGTSSAGFMTTLKRSVAIFLQVRGSVPIFWTQDGAVRPTPKIGPMQNTGIEKDGVRTTIGHRSFLQHLGTLRNRFGTAVVCLNLLKRSGHEHTLSTEFCEQINRARQSEGLPVYVETEEPIPDKTDSQSDQSKFDVQSEQSNQKQHLDPEPSLSGGKKSFLSSIFRTAASSNDSLSNDRKNSSSNSLSSLAKRFVPSRGTTPPHTPLNPWDLLQKGSREAIKRQSPHDSIAYLPFDFAAVCKNMAYERVYTLLTMLEPFLEAQGYTRVDEEYNDYSQTSTETQTTVAMQKGIIRTNCLDCLDRTNLVQARIGQTVLHRQLVDLGLLREAESQLATDTSDKDSKAHKTTQTPTPSQTQTQNQTEAHTQSQTQTDTQSQTETSDPLATSSSANDLQLPLTGLTDSDKTRISSAVSSFGPAAQSVFQHMWAEHGDTISNLYAGTNALKSDFTRTGQRAMEGVLNDSVNSLTRHYLNAFEHDDQQQLLDLLTNSSAFNATDTIAALSHERYMKERQKWCEKVQKAIDGCTSPKHLQESEEVAFSVAANVIDSVNKKDGDAVFVVTNRSYYVFWVDLERGLITGRIRVPLSAVRVVTIGPVVSSSAIDKVLKLASGSTQAEKETRHFAMQIDREAEESELGSSVRDIKRFFGSSASAPKEPPTEGHIVRVALFDQRENSSEDDITVILEKFLNAVRVNMVGVSSTSPSRAPTTQPTNPGQVSTPGEPSPFPPRTGAGDHRDGSVLTGGVDVSVHGGVGVPGGSRSHRVRVMKGPVVLPNSIGKATLTFAQSILDF